MALLPILSVNGAQAEVAAALAWLSSWGAPPLEGGWPDLDKVRGLGADCLMARGADRPDGPTPPCAALRVASGWVQPTLITAETPVDAVTGVWCWEAGNIRIIGETVGGVVRAVRVDARGLPVRAAAVPAVAGRTILGSIAAAL